MFHFAGGYFSDSLAFVSKLGCTKCPNGTYVSLYNRPGTHALNCTACPQGNDTPRALLKGVANYTAI